MTVKYHRAYCNNMYARHNKLSTKNIAVIATRLAGWQVAVFITRGPSPLCLRPFINPSTSQTHTHIHIHDTYTYLYMCMILCVYVVTSDNAYCVSGAVTDLWDKAILSSILNNYFLPIYICAKSVSRLYYVLKSFFKEEPGAVGTVFRHEHTSSWNVYMVTGVEGIRIKNGDVAWQYVHGNARWFMLMPLITWVMQNNAKYIFM